MVHVNPVGSAYLHVALVPDSTVFSDTPYLHVVPVTDGSVVAD